MEQVSKISIESLKESKYMKPVRMHYVQNGTSKIWDLRCVLQFYNTYIANASWLINLIPSLGHPSVAVVIYNKESDKLVLVKQLRPAVLFTELMNDASITSVNDMVKANDALKSNYIYFCSLTVSGVWHLSLPMHWYKGSLITISFWW